MISRIVQHTSAALTINENCDPDVRRDMAMAADKLVPENVGPYFQIVFERYRELMRSEVAVRAYG